jgi:hypothetical protein
MPVIREIQLELKTEEVLRREGFTGYAGARPEIKDLTIELLTGIENLLKPVIAYEIYRISETSKEKVNLEGGMVINGTLIPSTFPRSKEIAVAVCTIGPELEEQVTAYSKGRQALKGIILDGIGSAAVDSLIFEVIKIINKEVSEHNYQVSSPVSPGMPGLPITEQWNLLHMVPANEIGVSLTSSGIMIPRKSTSMVLGVGERMQKWEQAQVCANCNLNQTCPYRTHA